MKWNEKEAKEFLESLKAVSLSMREKTELRDQLEAYNISGALPQAHASVRSPMSFLFNPFFHPMPALALVLMIAVTTSTAAAAEGTLPGDFLYPIKVHVNEELLAALNSTPEKKASWELTRAERRIEEATVLAAEDKLDEKTRFELDRKVETHIETALALTPIEEPAAATLAIAAEVDVAGGSLSLTDDHSFTNEAERKAEVEQPNSETPRTTTKPDFDDNLRTERSIKRTAIKARAEATLVARDRLLRRSPTIAESNQRDEGHQENGAELGESILATRSSPEISPRSKGEKEVSKADDVLSKEDHDSTPEDVNKAEPVTQISAAPSREKTMAISFEAAWFAGETEALTKRLETAERTLSYAEIATPLHADLEKLRTSLQKAYELRDVMHTHAQSGNYEQARDALKKAIEIAFEVIEGTQDLLEKTRKEKNSEHTGGEEVSGKTGGSEEPNTLPRKSPEHTEDSR